MFDGRIAEDFKLLSGTWVSVGPLRARIIAAGAPHVQDVVIAGHDRDDVTAILIPTVDAGRDMDAASLHAHFQRMIDQLATSATGSSTRIARALWLDPARDAPLSIDAGEVTDKGSINQRALLRTRAALVQLLYAAPYDARVLCANCARYRYSDRS